MIAKRESSFISLAVILSAGLLAGWIKSSTAQDASFAAFEKRAKEALVASVKARKELGQKFFPKTQVLGSGWLLPWELPKALRKHASEEEYWQSLAGSFQQDSKAWMAGMISAFLEFSPQELSGFLDTWTSMARKEMPSSELPQGVTAEQFALGPVLLLLQWEFSPSLASRMELIARFLEETQKLMAKQIELRFGPGKKADAAPMRSSDDFMKELVLMPVKGLTVEQLKREIMTWGAAVKNMTGMTYSQCDNWGALQTGDEKAIQSLHLRHVVVILSILDRDKMSEVISDLTSRQASELQRKLNMRLGAFRGFGADVLGKKQEADLREELERTTNPTRRGQIQQEIAKLPELIAKFQKEMPTVETEVYMRDFGDNCYVINMKGNFKLPEFSWPLTNLQACLRNGSAVVFVGLGGNYAPEQLKKELDLFLSEMDSRTAFFRE